MLIYPHGFHDDMTAQSNEHGDGPVLTKKPAWSFHAAYSETRPADPQLSPLQGEDSRQRPAGIIATANTTSCATRIAHYAAKLTEFDVPVTHSALPTLMHGFMGFGPLSDGANARSTTSALPCVNWSRPRRRLTELQSAAPSARPRQPRQIPPQC